MEKVRPTVDDGERFKSALDRILDYHFADFLFASRLGREGYLSFPIPSYQNQEHYQIITSEKWNGGKRQLISYEDGTMSFNLREKEDYIDVSMILRPDGTVFIEGILPVSFLLATLELARQRGLLSDRNLIEPRHIQNSIEVANYLTPKGTARMSGVNCSLEINPEGKLLIKGAYLSSTN